MGDAADDSEWRIEELNRALQEERKFHEQGKCRGPNWCLYCNQEQEDE